MADIRFYVPLTKIDKENRTVAGYATTEVVDKQGDIVDYNASKEAFAGWPGNIREQHDSKAVGKAVEIIPDDEKRAVYVKAYISKGAQDTWEKILDGTLKGYSIGGNTLDKSVQIVKDTETQQSRQVTRITKYRLNELSLVDNPANPDATFTLVKRADDGVLYQTELVEDIQKVIMSDTDSMLEREITELREKADGLARKVLAPQDIEKLGDDEFAVIRKHISPQGKVVKERLLLMPDKVHAHTILRKLDSYPLSNEEREQVHTKAKDILGTSHKEEECKFCKSTVEKTGGDIDDMDKTVVAELIKSINTLCGRIDEVLKQEKPKQTGENPVDAPITPSSPEKPGDPDGKEVKTQVDQPVPATKAVGESDTEKAKNPATSDLKTQEVQPVPATKTAEATDVEKAKNPATSDLKTQDVQPVPTTKAANPAKSDLKTQEDQPVPTTKADKPKADEAEPVAEAAVETPEDEAAEDAEKAKKSQETGDIKKLTETVETLRKEVETLKKQPLPRKYAAVKIEKSSDNEPEDVDAQMAEVAAEVRKYTSAGREVPAELRKRGQELIRKSFDVKFGQSTTKVM